MIMKKSLSIQSGGSIIYNNKHELYQYQHYKLRKLWSKTDKLSFSLHLVFYSKTNNV